MMTNLPISLDRVLQSIETKEDVARFALDAIDQISLRFASVGDYHASQKIASARAEFTKVIAEMFP